MEFAPDLPIDTPRLRLRAFSRGDVDAVFAYRRLDVVARYLSDEPMTRESCAEAVQGRVNQLGFFAEGDRIFLAVERREDHAMLGEVTLILKNEEARQGEIGYVLHPDHHGRGYATEAAAALLDMGFRQAGLHRIFARCHAANSASWRVMERLGMRREAHFREHALVKGQWDEELIYAILQREWLARGAQVLAAGDQVPESR